MSPAEASAHVEYLDPDDVFKLIDRLGWHMRDRGLLLSAMAAPMPVFDHEHYITLPEKAGALMMAVNRNHPLLDGNKRLSWFLTVAFLELNGHDLVGPPDETDRFMRQVAANEAGDLAAVADWIERHVS